jgi:exonuclease V gamma subunit
VLFRSGLKIASDQNENVEQKEFFLSSLDKAIFTKETLQNGKSSSWKDLYLKGALPQGFLGKLSKEGFEEEKNKLFDACRKLSMDPEEFFTLELSTLCQKPKQVNSKHLIVPALEVVLEDNSFRVITGQIDLCHPKGLAFMSRHDFSDLLRVWPVYLVFLSILQRDAVENVEQNAIFLKSMQLKQMPIEDPLDLLRLYMAYFEKGYATPSPLLLPIRPDRAAHQLPPTV